MRLRIGQHEDPVSNAQESLNSYEIQIFIPFIDQTKIVQYVLDSHARITSQALKNRCHKQQ